MPDQENEKLYKGTTIEPPTGVADSPWPYAELDVTTNFSFLRGASHPDELVFTSAMLGQRAMAVTDINTLAGVVRAYEAARKVKGFRLIVGARLTFVDNTPDTLIWPTSLAAYGRLCRLLTLGRAAAEGAREKGACHLTLHDLLTHADNSLLAVVGIDPIHAPAQPLLQMLRHNLGDRVYLAASMLSDGDDRSRLSAFIQLGRQTGIPLVATNHVHYHDPGRRTLQDVLTCVRHGCVIEEAGYQLFPNAERYLKSPRQMHGLFIDYPAALHQTVTIADRCRFDLGEVKYNYPVEAIPAGAAPSQHLRELTYAGAADRYPDGLPDKVRDLIEKELAFICGSKYESYFLTVHDLVHYARSRGILCQGRGSAANSAVCYCLGVTAVDPARFQLVFERFASTARAEPPDIDIDFEHERREEVIQYVYEKYGRDRAAMTGSLTTYRGRSAIRDVGKALGFGIDTLDVLANKLDWWHKGTLSSEQLQETGVDPADPLVAKLIELTTELLGFPRHLSQHVGGMVISRVPLCELVPILPATMVDRTVIEWDKDDLDVLQMFKVDLLALGMLTCLSKSMAMVNARSPGRPLELHTIPPEDPTTYDMICDADTLGVFQIESRAQMSMLPRLRPRRFYDLVIEVAIVRPGPIQGDMVHPYLKRREMQRADPNYRVEYPKPELETVLKETLGVPLFQEQAMRIAMVAARFTGEEADLLRRAMAAWKRGGGIEQFHDKFVNGMTSNGYELDYALRCFQQICGFGDYGFPESHAASFAILVYASCWMKRHHPAAFAAGLLNSQPMGFYAPAQIVRDAREHGVDVRPIDVNSSHWDCVLQDTNDRHVKEAAYNSTPAQCDISFAPTDVGRAGQTTTTDYFTTTCKTNIINSTTTVTTTKSNTSRPKRTWGQCGPAVRLGFRQIKGLRESDMRRLVEVRDGHGLFRSVEHFQRATGLSCAVIRRLAEADAFCSFGKTRRQISWEAMALNDQPAPLIDPALDSGNAWSTPSHQPALNRIGEGTSMKPLHDGRTLSDPAPSLFLPPMPPVTEVLTDYATTGLSLKDHPVRFARPSLHKGSVWRNSLLKDPNRAPHGRWIKVAGLVLVRQRPGTASGVVFITIEDETGTANLILWSTIYEKYKRIARHATLLQADGYVQREGQVVHVLAKRLYDRSDLLATLHQPSRDFH